MSPRHKARSGLADSTKAASGWEFGDFVYAPDNCHTPNKRAFASRSAAKRGGYKGQHVYQCDSCGYYHVGTGKAWK